MYNVHEVLSWQLQIFYICKLYVFFHIYNPLIISLVGSHICFLHIPMKIYSAIHKHFTFGSHIALLHL